MKRLTRTKKLNDEVLIAEDDVVRLSPDDIEVLRAGALKNPRRRMRLCAHRSSDDRQQDMFIAIARGVYIRPHRHHAKAESLHVLEGEADAVFFDEAGAVTDVVRLGDYRSGQRFYYRVASPAYHMLLIRSEVFVFHEATSGPFIRSESEFAPWSPDEADAGAVKAFIEETERRIAGRR